MALNAPTNIVTMDADLGAVLSEFGQMKKSLAAIGPAGPAPGTAGEPDLIFCAAGANCHAKDM
jgi:hypothetical protein